VTALLETERLTLRQFRESDHEPLASYHGDPELTRFLGGPLSPAENWRWLLSMLGHWSLRGFGYWAVEEKRTGRLCGAAGLIRHFDWPETELGWRVYPAWQGNGFATEAARSVRDFAATALGLRALVSYIAPENGASIRVAERLGALRGEQAAVYRHTLTT
jgi:RimJ/RimL family protein N-acetyltransferase